MDQCGSAQKISIILQFKLIIMKLLFFCFIFFLPVVLKAQQTPESVAKLFIKSLELKDTTMLNQIMHPECVIYSTLEKDAQPAIEAIKKMSLMDYMRRAIKKNYQYREDLSNIQIDIRDNLATVKTDYKMYFGKEMSLKHCGVNVFVMGLNKDNKWLILSIADTRVFEDCENK